MRPLIWIGLGVLLVHGVAEAGPPWDRWNALEKQIRDGKIEPARAREELAGLHAELLKDGPVSEAATQVVFPVEGFGVKDLGGKDGSGYQPKGYRFYDGDRHKGHPAIDIFIDDRDQDGRSDRTRQPVRILSMTPGVVVATSTGWEAGSGLRGGNTVWVFDPQAERYTYYAHLAEVAVKPGDRLAAGAPLGTIGRTGKNAKARRSPTHLHLMALEFDGGAMTPVDLYPLLARQVTPVAASAQPGYAWLESFDPMQALENRIPPPGGATRIPVEPGSFGAFLRGLPLLPGQPPVLLHDGREKGNQAAHLFVVDIDVGRRDLQQCADAVMRLRAEYLFQKRDLAAIHFKYVSGFDARYTRWREGFRPAIKGSRVDEVKSRGKEDGWKSFRTYLDSVFTYANSASLEKEMAPVPDPREMKIGDVFIKGGFPGHAVIVADLAQDAAGKKHFLILQSYMPAQQIQVLRRPGSDSPWYPVDFGDTLETPEWTFKASELRRFED